jgi:tetratricopeptide (TPR) repeat protein
MKNKFFYPALMTIVFTVSVGFIIVKYRSNQEAMNKKVFTLLERTGPSAKTNEWINIRNQGEALVNQLKRDPENIKALVSMVVLFIQEARISGNFSYYDNAAMNYVYRILEKEPNSFEGLTYKALIQLSQHHFAEALQTGELARNLYPHSAFVYGILVDANVELGNYAAAVENSDKMISIRPDIRSYSRIAYLREIHGDFPGAIEAMKLAVEAGAPGQEATEWCRVQLGKLYELTGDLRTAEMHYSISLEERPHYAYALAGLGRIYSTRKEFEKAESLFRNAYEATPDYSFKEELAELYQSMGNSEKAQELTKSIIKEMNARNQNFTYSDSAGHYSDKEMATIYSMTNDYDNALEHVILEYNRRPGNIEVNELVAWIYFKSGKTAKALPYLKEAMKTNSKHPRLIERAKLIQQKI